MAERRKKRKRKTKGASSGGSSQSGGVNPYEAPQTGGVLQSLRSGFRRAAGAEKPEKESTLSKVIWGVIFAAAIGLLIARFLGLWGDERQPAEEERAPSEQADEEPEEPAKAPEPPTKSE